jgi:lipid-binding SYLF domain-containing protein
MTAYYRQSLSNTSPVRLSPNGTHSGLDFTIQNSNESGYIYLGGDASVSSSNYGFRILPNHSISFELPGKDAIYAVASTSGMGVSVIYTSLEF